MSRKIVPPGMESIKIEYWQNGKYVESKTVYIHEGDLMPFVNFIEDKLQPTKTTLKFKSMKSKETKNITLTYGLRHCKKRVLQILNVRYLSKF